MRGTGEILYLTLLNLNFSIETELFPPLFSGQVDLWTRKPTGCVCEWENNANRGDTGTLDAVNASAQPISISSPSQNCACCVKGGCQCGSSSPARCGQCGLEQYCVNSKFINSSHLSLLI